LSPFCDSNGKGAHSPQRVAALQCQIWEQRNDCLLAAGARLPRWLTGCELDEGVAFRYRLRFY